MTKTESTKHKICKKTITKALWLQEIDKSEGLVKSSEFSKTSCPENLKKIISMELIKIGKIEILIFLNFIYLFMAALGLHCCCVQAFSSCGEWGLLFVAVSGLLIVVASLVVEHGL